MKKVLFVMLFTAVLCGCNGIEKGSPIRPLASDYVEVVRTADINNPLYTPTICLGDNGRLIGAYEYGFLEKNRYYKKNKTKADLELRNNAHIVTSDDGGKTWTERATCVMSHGRIFKAGKSFYYLGHKVYENLFICRSDDNGETWTQPVELISPQFKIGFHQSACNVWYDKGNVYLVMEHRMVDKCKVWMVSELAPVVMRAKITDDLTKVESWTFSNQVSMLTLLDNFEKNELPQLDFFGVPFFKQEYPLSTCTTSPKSKIKRTQAPLGMLETNIVKIVDPHHIWYDPAGKTFLLFMRSNTMGLGGYCNVLKAVEKDDGSIEVGFLTAPSGKKILFLPNPVGAMRFHICYDEKTKLYWILGSQPTQSMRNPDNTGKRNDSGRQRMVLHFSENLVDWSFAGLVDKGETLKSSRHYASMQIDGDDLVILSRSGDDNARSAHDGNIITFHRVKNFRDLVY